MKKAGLWNLAVFAGLLVSGCGRDTGTMQSVKDPIDTHTFSRPEQARTVHLELDIDVDFDTRIISGIARHEIQNNGTEEFIVDIQDINILKVTLGNSDEAVTHRMTESTEHKGRALVIPITKGTEYVEIYYFTSPDAEALGWLEPSQTAGKEMPFLYTQGQAILTRSWIPLQDSPGIRFTYDARVQVPPGMLAVMSASNPTEKNEDGVYEFEMNQPVPAYLIALAAGDIAFTPIGERTGVYAEPSVLEAAASEFEDTEQMLEIAEDLYGAYLWERYDLIVLPPSFPFGGMENPRLTFATPTVIAGDKSLVSLVAHELAHSWSGNLVTNATWNDFWINEGFTVYFERRIMEELEGREYADMLWELGRQDLQRRVSLLGKNSPDTKLHLDLEGRNPDDGMTDVAYEKGAHFLLRLEELAGRDRFDAFLNDYFEEYQFQTMHTRKFEEYLKFNLLGPEEIDINLNKWLYDSGIPEDMPVVRSTRFERVNAVLRDLAAGTLPGRDETAGWSTHEWLHFIRNLPESVAANDLRRMDNTFGFAESGNAEIAAAWYEVAIRRSYADEIMPAIESFLVRVGRRKFLVPIYTALKEEGELDSAREIYSRARPGYHAVSRSSLEPILLLE